MKTRISKLPKVNLQTPMPKVKPPRSDKKIYLFEFEDEMKLELLRFGEFWLKEREKDPKLFPISLTLGEWEEQYRIWSNNQ